MIYVSECVVLLGYKYLLIVSACLCYSIEFDRDADYFAIAGVTRKIKVLWDIY